MPKKLSFSIVVVLLFLFLSTVVCAPPPPVEPPEEKKEVEGPPDPAQSLPMADFELDEANGVAVARGLRGDAIGYFDAGETGGGKRLFLRDFGLTDPGVQVTIECLGYNISGNLLDSRGVTTNLRQGTNPQGKPMVDSDGTPIIVFNFEGGWHEICGIYLA